MKIFAGMDVGSYEVHMNIYEINDEGGVRTVDELRQPVDLGTSSFATGQISGDAVDDLCDIMNRFKRVMEQYRVDDFRIYGTSAIRETKNTWTLLDQIRQRTGFDISILSNSEQRFLNYKAVALTDMRSGDQRTGEPGESTFGRILSEGAVILDIGGGSIQISIFEDGRLITTQNLRLGVLRLNSNVRKLDADMDDTEMLVDEIVGSQFATFKKLFMKDGQISNIVLLDDYLSPVITGGAVGMLQPSNHMDRDSLETILTGLRHRSAFESAELFDVSSYHASLMYFSAILLKHAFNITDATSVWVPGACLCDGIVYEYGEQNKLFNISHNFEKDIIASARQISKRYKGSVKRSRVIEKLALAIFDNTLDIHGMGSRERLLLRICCMLHDCGKYINFSTQGDCSYQIVMATEIIGLSHKERELVAKVVMYNYTQFEYSGGYMTTSIAESQEYMKLAKLTAILKLATALDRSHKGKFKDVDMEFEDDTLTIWVKTSTDVTLERGLLASRADFFREIFNVRPVIKVKK